MKNILIVCIQGLTSGILARKLNMTAEKENEDYRFLSCGISDAANHLEWADYVILTPQVRDRAQKLDEEVRKNGAVCLTLSDTAISFQKTEETFRNIIRAVSPPEERKQRPEPGALKDALIMIAPLIIPGIIAWIAARFAYGPLNSIYSVTAGIACLWFAPAYGYYLFARRGENSLTGILTGLLILMTLTPLRRDIVYAPEEFSTFHGIMDISYWSLLFLPVCAAAETLFLNVVLVCSGLQTAYLAKHRRRIADRSFMLFTAGPLTVMMTFLLLIRTILFSML